MKPEVQSWVRNASITAGVLGAVLSPIPLADEVLLLPLFGALSWKIGTGHGLTARELPWGKLGAAAVAGLGARAAAGLAFALIPGVAAVTNALSAAALTRAFAATADSLCEASAHGDDPMAAAAVASA